MQLPIMAAILRNAGGGEHRVVAEDAAEVVFVGKDLILQRQKDAGGIDEIDQRQSKLSRDRLGPQHLLDRLRKQRAGFDGGVVGDDQQGRPLTQPMPVTTPAAGTSPHSGYMP